MIEHLSQDQISRWILGQATADEDQHGRDCAKCSAELNRFRNRVSTFRVAMQEWSGHENVPKLEATPRTLFRPKPFQPLLRWALAATTVGVLLGIPVSRLMNEPAADTNSTAGTSVEMGGNPVLNSVLNEDVLLMEEVYAHLSRPIPMPMERVMVLLPNEAEEVPEGRPEANAPEGKEIR